MTRLLALLLLVAPAHAQLAPAPAPIPTIAAIPCDGTTNAAPAINAAIAAAAARPTGGTVLLPAGLCRVRLPATPIRPRSNVTLAGIGPASVLLIDDAEGGHAGITNAQGATWAPLENFHLRDLTLRGLAATHRTQGAHLARLSGKNLTVTRVSLEDSRFMAIVFGESDEVAIRDSRVTRAMRDGIAVWDTPNVLITGNIIQSANDDAISVHTGNTAAAPIRAGIIIANNLITESQGIKVLGAKAASISNNVLRRIMALGLYVEAAAQPDRQGQTPIFAVRISNNIVADVFRRPEFPYLNQEQYYLRLGGGARIAGPRIAGALPGPPGEPAPGSGLVTPLFGSGPGTLYANIPAPAPAGRWIDVEGNQFVRTLPAVDRYADWGYDPRGLWVGHMGTNAGGDGSLYYNGPVTEAHLATTGIRLGPATRGLRITGNTIATTGPIGIAMSWRNGPPVRDLDHDGLEITANRITGATLAAIQGPPGATAQRILVARNTIDGDPHFAHANRGPAGTWRSADAPLGLDIAAGTGWRIEANSFRNLAAAIRATAPQHLSGNTLFAAPAATGFSPANAGIGLLPPASSAWAYALEDSNPASPGYASPLFTPPSLFDAMPDAGTWVEGQIAAASPHLPLLGWRRRTTGTLHRPDTDWSPIPLGTPEIGR